MVGNVDVGLGWPLGAKKRGEGDCEGEKVGTCHLGEAKGTAESLVWPL